MTWHMLFGMPLFAAIAATAAACTVVFYMWRALRFMVRAIVRSHNAIVRIDRTVSYVEKEMRHNGGDTMRDELSHQTDRLDRLVERQCAITRRLDALEAPPAQHRQSGG